MKNYRIVAVEEEFPARKSETLGKVKIWRNWERESYQWSWVASARFVWIERVGLVFISSSRQPEATPAEYARANKELRKLSGYVQLINELKAKQKPFFYDDYIVLSGAICLIDELFLECHKF
ncbi:unnamed protein product [Trifolium pratense]|uniref:Uncharacterized protein n=1 Tax=Trifolium pratense TaxID=57577 RepID=A0ACB0IPE3_TRIPR|nr:unnamed protein product [Trifolium pratense]